LTSIVVKNKKTNKKKKRYVQAPSSYPPGVNVILQSTSCSWINIFVGTTLQSTNQIRGTVYSLSNTLTTKCFYISVIHQSFPSNSRDKLWV